MKLIVGLGNPGQEYIKTRHNVGFMVIDNYVLKNNIEINKKKFNGLYGETLYKDEKILFLKPQSYINLSGEVIKKYLDFYKISIENVLIIHDDMDIELGKYKLKAKGNCGGHNGLKNIEINFNTKEYKRLKIGISSSGVVNAKDYVLGKLSNEEQEKIRPIIELSTKVIDDFCTMDFINLMNKYNHK